MKKFYPLLQALATPAVAAFSRLHPDLKPKWMHRYFPPYIERTSGSPKIWMHAASATEARLAAFFAETFKAIEPDAQFLLTTNTNPGVQEAKKQGFELIRYFPFDMGLALKKMFREFRPDAIVSIEMELWPGFIELAKRGDVPFVVINARLSEKRIEAYQRLNNSFHGLLRHVVFLTRTDVDMDYLARAGATLDKMLVTGEMKLDLMKEGDDGAIARRTKHFGQCLLGVSTHQGEEEILLDAFEQLREIYPEMVLVIAPKHLSRAAAVKRLATNRGLTAVLAEDDEISELAFADVIVEDGFGRMGRWYETADAVFVGGSLVDKGGHNVLEPVLQQVSTMVGKHHENWWMWVNLLDDEGAVDVIEGAEDIVRIVPMAIEQREEIMPALHAARAKVLQNRGSTKRNAEALKNLLEGKALFETPET